MPERCALISVYDKTGIEDFGRSLVRQGWRIYSSGGTAKALRAADVPCTDVSELVGGEAILGHRVVTLSREIHAGLMARQTATDQAELETLGVPFIDLVCVDLYPLAEEIAKPGATPESVIEKTDIGGPALLRSASKGRRIVVCLPQQRPEVLRWLNEGEPHPMEFRQALASRAEAVIADYCLASARYHSLGRFDGLIAETTQVLKYGENAAQTPAHLLAVRTDDPLAIDRFQLVAGTSPSYNNLAELDRHLQTITHIAAGWERNFHTVPNIALGTKHGNACGAAVGDDPAEVIRQMVMGDPRAIFGGLVMVNFELTEELAGELLSFGVDSGRRLLDAVIAPSFAPEAIQMLSRKGDKCRFLANPALAELGTRSIDTTPVLRQVRGGYLRQPNYTWVAELNSPDVTRTGELTDQQQRDAILAWAICCTSNSNTVTLTYNGHLIGNGVGQQDRVGCCELAIKRATDAGHSVQGAVAASDSFFPFPDGPETLIKAGVKAIWATSGSVRDEESRQLCREHNVALWQVPDSLGRGFFGH
jgi:phosphoribosylaminoimidazolecarboxamide formyltransferase / IMP cyclohydrolase